MASCSTPLDVLDDEYQMESVTEKETPYEAGSSNQRLVQRSGNIK